MPEEAPLGRSVLAAVAWAFCWYAAAIALAFEIAEELNPRVLSSRFFYMWTFATSVGWFATGAPAGFAFVLLEWRWRAGGTRDSSAAGWRALLLGASVGVCMIVAGAMISGGLEALALIDPLGLGFSIVLGGGCGLATFLVDRQIVRFFLRRQRATT